MNYQRRIDKHLAPYLGHRKLTTITASDVRAFIAKRQDDLIVVKKAVVRKLPDGTELEVPHPPSRNRSRTARSIAN